MSEQNIIERIEGLENDSVKRFAVNTNDSKFDDVKQIIGDEAKDLVPYLITNYPINDSNFIHGGAAHTVLGMQYGDMQYGSQLSISFKKMKYRTLNNGIWLEWQTIGGEHGNVGDFTNNFNNLIQEGTYAYGGQDYTNKPAGFGMIEVLRFGSYITQKRYNADSIGIRCSWDNGQTWSAWKYTNLS